MTFAALVTVRMMLQPNPNGLVKAMGGIWGDCKASPDLFYETSQPCFHDIPRLPVWNYFFISATD